MQRNTDQSNISALEFATQCISMGENLRFSRDVLRQAFGQILEIPVQSQVTPISEPNRPWREEGDIIYFSVTSNGRTGKEWITHFEEMGVRLSDYAKQLLRSPDFQSTSGVKTEIAVLKGMLFEDNDRITKNIRAEADKRKFTNPDVEVACLIREKFTDEDIEAMGLWWVVVMHEPIKDSDGLPDLLSADRHGEGPWLHAYCGYPGIRWRRGRGFAFAVLQV